MCYSVSLYQQIFFGFSQLSLTAFNIFFVSLIYSEPVIHN
jgi:hypothetical protein